MPKEVIISPQDVTITMESHYRQPYQMTITHKSTKLTAKGEGWNKFSLKQRLLSELKHKMNKWRMGIDA